MSTKNIYNQILSVKNAQTPQTQPILGREAEMVANSAGGVVFALDDWSYLDRFLILGSEQNSYYATARALTIKAASNVLKLIALDPIRVVNRIVEISDSGRAPKNDSAIFALALVAIHGSEDGRKVAYDTLPKVCRIGTHLFQFVEAINEMGKWNAGAKRGVSNWYNSKDVDKLAYQMLKYQNRNGWKHRDVLRLAHVKPDGLYRSSLYGWAAESKPQLGKLLSLPEIIVAYKDLHLEGSEKLALQCIEDYNMSWEMLPTHLLKSPAIWEALLPGMGYTALIRNLGRMGAIGMLKPLSDTSIKVIDKLSDGEALRRSRVHPISVLSAYKTYGQGKGDKGSLTWDVNQRVVEALNSSFYDAFENVEPTGKKFFMGIDCSGSMFSANVCGLNNLNAAEAAAVMAMAIVRNESNYWIGGFNTKMSELRISPNMQLKAVLTEIADFHWGGTNVSLPMLHATQHKMDVDCFVSITDNETWAGSTHPTEALRRYRQEMNKPNACAVVCGTSVTNFTVADPKDPRQLDVVGFDAAAPQIIADFARHDG